LLQIQRVYWSDDLLKRTRNSDSTLQELNISWNKFGNEGAQYLSNALKINTTLKKLDIAYNFIGNEGAGYLADALKINTSLQYLDISNNNIGDEGARYLVSALKMNCNLTVLDTSSNNFSNDNIVSKISKLIKRNQDSGAITKIGMMLKDGRPGVGKDLKRAQVFLRRSMSMGNAEATFQLGEPGAHILNISHFQFFTLYSLLILISVLLKMKD